MSRRSHSHRLTVVEDIRIFLEFFRLNCYSLSFFLKRLLYPSNCLFDIRRSWCIYVNDAGSHHPQARLGGGRHLRKARSLL